MPWLDHFRRRRASGNAAPSPAHEEQPLSRLQRLVARQKIVPLSSDSGLGLEALEEEFSPPLYDLSVYTSPLGKAED